MPTIRKLSDALIGRIAAGEVVERPASAVKELVENSIDAGAKSITVELRGGGTGYLRVSDNGCGILETQVRMAFERHATSKLINEDGLFDIRTLGFRGEALASIAAVAKVTLTTRVKDTPFGVRARVEGGEFVDIRQAASPVGTSVVVEDMFFNTPVRLKFLKKPSTEAGLVADYMLRLILSRPDIAFRFANEGKTVYRSVGDGKVESALFCVYGREALDGMYRVSGNMNGALVSGYIGVGELSRGNRQQQSFFVNGRCFRSLELGRALENGCEGRLMTGRFPMCALYLDIPYNQVDVNVHPNKLEVRFQNERGVAQAIEALAREALSQRSLGDALRAGEKSGASAEAGNSAGLAVSHIQITELGGGSAEADAPAEKSVGVADDKPTDATAGKVASAIADTPAENIAGKHNEAISDKPADSESEALSRLKPIVLSSHANEAYTLRESTIPKAQSEAWLTSLYGAYDMYAQAPLHSIRQPSGVSMANHTDAKAEIAQAAAGNTVFTTPQESPTQTTLDTLGIPAAAAPRLIGVAFDTYWIFEAGDKLLMVDQHAAHERMLFDKLMKRYENERVSQSLLSPLVVRLTAREHALALELTDTLADAGFEIEDFDESCIAIRAIPTLFGLNEEPRALLMEALDEWQSGRGEVTRERMRRQVAQIACKRAIKGGDRLSEGELKGFLEQMLLSGSMPTCPHGRPIVTEITRLALEKRFKRVL